MPSIQDGTNRYKKGFWEDVNSFLIRLLTCTSRIPISRGRASGQFQCGRAERLTKLNLKTTSNTMTRKCSMMLMDLNSTVNKLTLLATPWQGRYAWLSVCPLRLACSSGVSFSSVALLLPSCSFSFNSRQHPDAAWGERLFKFGGSCVRNIWQPYDKFHRVEHALEACCCLHCDKAEL